MIIDRVELINNPAVFYAVSQSAFGIPFYLKLEHLNMAGSIKIKTARYLMQSGVSILFAEESGSVH